MQPDLKGFRMQMHAAKDNQINRRQLDLRTCHGSRLIQGRRRRNLWSMERWAADWVNKRPSTCSAPELQYHGLQRFQLHSAEPLRPASQAQQGCTSDSGVLGLRFRA